MEPQDPFTVRLALESDAAAVASIGADVFTMSFGHAVKPESLAVYLKEEYSTDSILKDIKDPLKTIFVSVDHNARVVGFGYLTRGSAEPCLSNVSGKFELQRLYVHSSAQGKGIGNSLVKSLEKVALEEGFTRAWLGVWEENTRAIRAYERWGFQTVGEHDFQIGSDVHKDLIMLKVL